ncbi:MAG: DinB family protein [Flavobacteriaceae bacterium]|nr:DinB family protein [Flavobacteriaceae bacterium]
MEFNLKESIEILERTPSVLEALLKGLSASWIRADEGQGSWSPYVVVGHLIHGEKTDWMVRANIILSQKKNKNFTPYDRFAQLHEDQDRPLKDMLSEFRQLRSSNLGQLKAKDISNEELRSEGTHPELGKVTLQQLISAWVVHDLNHIVQISRVMAKRYDTEVGPWKAYLGILRN